MTTSSQHKNRREPNSEQDRLSMSNQDNAFTTIPGLLTDVDHIVELSARVQAALKASGSLQEIGPLQRETVATAAEEKRCFVLKDSAHTLVGCAFIKEIGRDWYHQNADFDIDAFPAPWLFLYSIMLETEIQGKGTGISFLRDVVRHIEPLGGTVFLDCWAGSDKLRNFYERAGCRCVAVMPENDYEIAVFVWNLARSQSSRKSSS